MVEISISLEDSLLPILKEIANRIQDFRPVFKKIEAHMIGSIEKNFEAQGRPERWAPWKNPEQVILGRLRRLKKYKGAKREKKKEMINQALAVGGRILLDTGTLRRSVTGRSHDYTRKMDKLEFRMGTRLAYAPVHQYGSAKKNIPARPFLLFQKEDVEAIQELVIRYLWSSAR